MNPRIHHTAMQMNFGVEKLGPMDGLFPAALSGLDAMGAARRDKIG